MLIIIGPKCGNKMSRGISEETGTFARVKGAAWGLLLTVAGVAMFFALVPDVLSYSAILEMSLVLVIPPAFFVLGMHMTYGALFSDSYSIQTQVR